MPKNQLFKINPDAIIMNSLLNSFGLSGLTDTRYFTRKNMLENSTIKIIENMIPTLISYYLPCKAKIYLIALSAPGTKLIYFLFTFSLLEINFIISS